MALVSPIEMRAARSVAYLHPVIVRPVDDDGIVMPPSKDVGMLIISPLAVRPERVPEVVGVIPGEVVVRVVSPLESGEETEEVSLNRPVIFPTQGMRHAME